MTTPPFNPQPCCGDAASASCMAPVQFCQTSTSVGPVDHAGRSYDLTLPINQGFTVASMQVDAVNHPAGITWSVLDADGSQFATALKNFMESRLPTGVTVTVTNPNAGQAICGNAAAFQIHIECIRLDQDPPDLIELVYNGGTDKVLNPAYLPYTSFTSNAKRQDNGGLLNCTSVANLGWETNDVNQAFEFWGSAATTPEGACTPTPRGTPIQEINANGSATPPYGDTIWQTFTVSPAEAGSTFNIRVVVGGRNKTDAIRIRLFTGDPANPAAAPGDLIDTTVNAPSVTPTNGPNPWTNYSNSLPLNAGTYTLAFTGPDDNPAPGAVGGLFTDMRAFIDRPGIRATATRDDTDCVVTTQEESTTSVCSYWQPVCSGGAITNWTNVETGVTLTNALFWAQTPKPECCSQAAQEAAAGGGGTPSNMAISDLVCVTIGGIQSTAIRVVIIDSSGGALFRVFIGDDGVAVTPDHWTPGECAANAFVQEEVLCDVQPGGTIVEFRRTTAYVIDAATGRPRATSHNDFQLNSDVTYTPTGTVLVCTNTDQFTTTGLCLGDGTPIGIVNRRTLLGTVVQDGWVNLLTGTFSAGAPPVGTTACGTSLSIQQSDVLCDITPGDGVVHGLVLIQYHYAPDGSIMSTDIVSATTGAPYVPVGTVTVCPTDTSAPDNDMQILCDRQGDGSLVSFVRDYHRDGVGAINGFTDYNLAGAPYTVTGTVQSCIPRVAEVEILCDATGTRFVRTYTFNSAGTIASFADTNLAGAPFVPTGAVGLCPSQVGDTEIVQLCDTSGGVTTPFFRRYTFDSAGTVTTTVNTTPAGAPYAPVGVVGVCPQAQAPVTVAAHHFDVLPGTPWVPGSTPGTEVSVTYSVLSGTATVVDSDGTSVAGIPAGFTGTWNQDQNGPFTPPQSITSVGGRILVLVTTI